MREIYINSALKLIYTFIKILCIAIKRNKNIQNYCMKCDYIKDAGGFCER